MNILTNPDVIPLVGMIAGMLTVVTVVAIVSWFKGRNKELQYHQDLRIREMEHQVKMKQLEIELEKAKARNSSTQAA